MRYMVSWPCAYVQERNRCFYLLQNLKNINNIIKRPNKGARGREPVDTRKFASRIPTGKWGEKTIETQNGFLTTGVEVVSREY